MDELKAGVNQQADIQRKRIQQQEAAASQQTNDAIKRRAASMGGGPSGAFVKQEQIARDESAKRVQDANEGVDAQANAQLNELRKVQQGQEYGTSERVASQGFSADQAAMQRKFMTTERLGGQQFATGERLGGQDFATAERLGGQKFATGERLGGQEFTSGQNDKQIKAAYDQQVMAIKAAADKGDLDRKMADRQLAALGDQFNAEMEQNVTTNKINAIVSGFNSKIPPGQFGDLLRSIGIDIGNVPGLTSDLPGTPPAPVDPYAKKESISGPRG